MFSGNKGLGQTKYWKLKNNIIGQVQMKKADDEGIERENEIEEEISLKIG